MKIHEIAKLAGVSIGTVDRVLHKRGRVAAETAKRVSKIIEENNYSVNRFASNLRLNRDFNIAIVMPILNSEFGYWKLIKKGIDAASAEIKELGGVTLHFAFFNRYKESSCLNETLALFEKITISGLIIAPVVPEDVEIILNKYPSVPYIFIDSPLPQLNPLKSFAQNPFRGGFLAGKLMGLLSPGPGTFVTIQTYNNAYNSRERARGFKQFFINHSEIEILELTIDFRKNIKEKFINLFEENNQIKGFFVVNDGGHIVGNTLIQINRKKNITVLGYDLIKKNREAMLNGAIDCILSQRPENQGYNSVHLLYKHLMLENFVPKKQEIPFDIFFLENLIEIDE